MQTPHPLVLRAGAAAIGLGCCAAGVAMLGAPDLDGRATSVVAPAAASAGPACTALATPERPPIPAPECTAAAPAPPDGVDLDGVTYGVASEDDDLLVVDPACDGHLVVLVVEPEGTVSGFAHRPTGDDRVYAMPLARATPGQVLAAGAGSCPQPVLQHGFEDDAVPVPLAALRREATP